MYEEEPIDKESIRSEADSDAAEPDASVETVEESVRESAEVIRSAAGVVVATEVVDDRWIRYTVLESSGDEHCVGSRLEPIVSSADFVALRAYRAAASAAQDGA